MTTRHQLYRSNSFRSQKQEMDRKLMFEEGQSKRTLSSIERERQALLQDLQGIKTRSSSFRDSTGHYNYVKNSNGYQPSGEEIKSPCSYSRNMYGSQATPQESREFDDSRQRANSFSPSLLRRDFPLQRPSSYSPTLLRKAGHGCFEGNQKLTNRHSDIVQSRSHPVSPDLRKTIPPCRSQSQEGGHSTINGSDSYHYSLTSSPVSQRRANLLRKAEQLEGDIIRRQTDRGGFMYGEINGERWEHIKMSKYHAAVRKPVAAFAMPKQSKASP